MDTNIIYCGDNLEVLEKYMPSESVDMVYIDPPFNSDRRYEVFWGEAQERRAFDDRFGDVMTYLEWMRPRLRELHRVLKPEGNFFYHCDWHASHYVKVELDRLFGMENFRNEIIWYYPNKLPTGGNLFDRQHDVILWYSMSKKYTFNEIRVESEYKGTQLQTKKVNGKRIPIIDPDTGKQVRKMSSDKPLGDVWRMNMLHAQSKERLGYPTQKPLSLLERLISAGSREGQVILDAFCGCGTTLESAAIQRRKWIGIDFSPTACRVMGNRLGKLGMAEGRDFEMRDMPKSESQLRKMPHFEFQNWAVIALGGIPNRVKSGDYGIDGRLYVADVAPKEKGAARDLFGDIDNWYPIQVKQVDKAGRPDIDSFETAMQRDRRVRGYFVAFGFSSDAYTEIKRANTHQGLDIVPVTVAEILEHERVAVSV